MPEPGSGLVALRRPGRTRTPDRWPRLDRRGPAPRRPDRCRTAARRRSRPNSRPRRHHRPIPQRIRTELRTVHPPQSRPDSYQDRRPCRERRRPAPRRLPRCRNGGAPTIKSEYPSPLTSPAVRTLNPSVAPSWSPSLDPCLVSSRDLRPSRGIRKPGPRCIRGCRKTAPRRSRP